jgi:hypothetical protein
MYVLLLCSLVQPDDGYYWNQMDVDTQQRTGQDSAPRSSSMGQDTLLSQLLEHSHVSQSCLIKLAHQLDELKQTVVSMASGAIQGSNKPTVVEGLASPLTGTQGPSSSHARRKGPPGTFRDPVPPPAHREDPTNRFHVSYPPYSTGVVVLTKLE